MKLKLLFIQIILLFSTYVLSQTSYTYTDPCSGVAKSIVIPTDGVTMNYFGQIKTFTLSDFQNGLFDSWAIGVLDKYGNISPCTGVTIINSVATVAQTTANSFLNIVNTVSAVSGVASSASGVASNTSGVASTASDATANTNIDVNVGGDGGGTTDVVGSSGSDNTTSASDDGGSTTNGGGSSGNSKSGGGGKSSSSNTKSVPKPTLIANSDYTAFYFVDANPSWGGKISGGYTSVRWDGATTYGITFDYISAMGGGNINGFYALLNPKHVDIFSSSISAGYVDTTLTIYGTVSAGQLWNITHPANLKLMYMVSTSYGNMSGEQYFSTAVILGGMYDIKITNTFALKTTLLYVYAPYIRYYDDYLLKSPHVILPIIGTNIGITKRFKININFGTTWPIGSKVSSYSLIMGTRLML
jgi:hypothetical protein